ncbi:aminotransferase class V-fold PLP-dependent enzyme, partial [bacterium]
PSLMKPLLQAHEEGALNLAVIHVDSSGQMSFGSVADADVAFIVSAHNETGILTDWSSLLPLIKPDTILVTDASQSLARIGAPPARVDAIVASAHKLGGIAGVGVLLLRRNAKKLPAPWSGGGQEGGLRPGTESLALIAAFGAAAELIERSREQHRDLLELRDSIEKKFLAEVAHAQVLGAFVERLPNTSAITLSNVDGEALRMAIDLEGICVGFGSACSGLAPEPSPALLALGLTANQARATIRLSFYPGIDRPRLDESLQSLIRIALLIAR